MRTRQAEEEQTVGMIVDGVVEVLNLAPSDIEDTPDFGPGISTPYLTGMAKIKGKVKILLDIDQVLASDELGGFTHAIANGPAFPRPYTAPDAASSAKRVYVGLGCEHRSGSLDRPDR